MLETTIAGSLPKPAWLATPRALWAPWRVEGPALEEGKRDAVALALRDQERAGIDIVTDGEQSRRHFVWGFVESLDGVDFTKMVTIGIRADRYKADVPTVTAPVRRRGSIHGAEARFARGQTTRRLKLTMPGPMTIVDTIHDGYYGSRAKLGMALAKLLNEEARELEALGVDMIQFDEPAFNVYMDEVRDWGVAALDAAVEGLRCRTAVHICYGYGIKANNDWKQTLGGEWRQYEQHLPPARALADRRRLPRVRSLARPDLAHRSARGQGHPARRHRRRHRHGGDSRGRRPRDPRRASPTCRRPAHLPLHQLRHGPPRPRGRARQTPRPRRRRGHRPQRTRRLAKAQPS